jgi:hypothetical protein
MTAQITHLTLAELAASENPADLPEGAAAHLETCPACQARARHALPDGVRSLLAGCQPPPRLLQDLFEAIDSQQVPARAQWGGGRIVLTAAAAAVLLGAAGAGAVTALRPATPAPPGSATRVAAGLTATGCTGTELAGGTLDRVSGTSLVLATVSGKQVTVTTSASTRILREVTGTPGDVADGSHVLVSGTSSGGAIAARLVSILPETAGSPPTPLGGATAGLALGLADGTVADASGDGFTVVEHDGTRVAVTMSSSTSVITTVQVSVSQLRIGAVTSAAGTAGPGGTLAAATVEQNGLPAGTLRKALPAPPSLPSGLPSPGTLITPGAPGSTPRLPLTPGTLIPKQGGGSGSLGLGCAPAAITTADLITLGS